MKSLDKINLLILKNDIVVNFPQDNANVNNIEENGDPLGKGLNNKEPKQVYSSSDYYYNNLCSF